MTTDETRPEPVSEQRPLAGLRICSFESRKGDEMQSLIERHGGIATIAPSMREIPLDQNPEVFEFAELLLDDKIDVVILLTGVGARGMLEAIEQRYDRTEFIEALQQTVLIVRGPKPAAVLREWKIPFQYQVPEPNTWRDLLALLDEKIKVAGKTLAVQEYGKPPEELYAGLAERQANTVRVPVYRWALPEDTRPLEAAVQATIAGDVDVLMFTSAHQLHNVLAVAEMAALRDAWLTAAGQCVIASIGPTASEMLAMEGLPVDIQPEHPKMGHLVLAVAREGRSRLEQKRRRSRIED